MNYGIQNFEITKWKVLDFLKANQGFATHFNGFRASIIEVKHLATGKMLYIDCIYGFIMKASDRSESFDQLKAELEQKFNIS